MHHTNEPVAIKGFAQFRLPGDVSLLAREDERFQTVTVAAVIQTPLSAEATAVALLAGLLERGTRSHPSQARFAGYLEDLYGARLDAGVAKHGERLVFSAVLQVLADRAVPAGHRGPAPLDAGLGLLGEFLYAPHLADGHAPDPEARFPAVALATERDRLDRYLRALSDDKPTYGLMRAFEELGRGRPIGVSEHGDRDALAALTSTDLAHAWWRLTHVEPLVVFVIGPQPVDTLRDRVAAALGNWLSARTPRALEPLRAITAAVTPVHTEEQTGGEQAHVFRVFRTPTSFASPDAAPLVLLDGVLGRYPFSRLFERVREAQGLAYDVSSFVERHAGLVVCHAGVTPERAPACLEAMDAELNALAEGEVDADRFRRAQATLASEYREIPETRLGWMRFFFARRLAGIAEHPDEVAVRIMAVTPDDVVRVANGLALDTTFVLS